MEMKNNFEKIGMIMIFLVGILSIHLGRAQEQYYGCPMYGGIENYGFGIYFGMVIQILIIIALVLLIFWMVKKINWGENGKRK